MNKLLVITVLVALLALSAESFRVPRQVEEEEQGTISRFTGAIKYYYNSAVDKVSECLDSIKGMKFEEKALNFYEETTSLVGTYAGILNDQMYHIVYPQK